MSEVFIEKTKGLPDAEAMMKELLHGSGAARWDPFKDDFERMVRALDIIAPVQAYYLPLAAPAAGEAPLEIKQEWIGLRLPVRSKRQTPEFGLGFTVLAREALEVLSRERPHANRWWRNQFAEDVKCKSAEVKAEYEAKRGEPASAGLGYINNPRNEFDEYIVNFDAFTFDPEEGVILPHAEFLGSLMTHDVFFAEVYMKQQAAIAT